MKNVFSNTFREISKFFLVAIAVFVAILASAPTSFYLVQAKEENASPLALTSPAPALSPTNSSPLSVFLPANSQNGFLYHWQAVSQTKQYVIAVFGNGQFALFGTVNSLQACQDKDCAVGQKRNLTSGKTYLYAVLAFPAQSWPILSLAQFTLP